MSADYQYAVRLVLYDVYVTLERWLLEMLRAKGDLSAITFISGASATSGSAETSRKLPVTLLTMSIQNFCFHLLPVIFDHIVGINLQLIGV